MKTILTGKTKTTKTKIITLRRLNRYIVSGEAVSSRKYRQLARCGNYSRQARTGRHPVLSVRMAASVLVFCFLIMSCALGFAASSNYASVSALSASSASSAASAASAAIHAVNASAASSFIQAIPAALVTSTTNSSSAPTPSGNPASTWDAKDETIYINLNNNGSIEMVNVVNRFENLAAGNHIEASPYESLQILSAEGRQLHLNPDSGAVTWETVEPAREFYYQGRMDAISSAFSATLMPWTFDISYTLDGKPEEAAKMFGAEGLAGITITAAANPDTNEYYRKNMMAQISVYLSMDSCSDIYAPDAVNMVAGRVHTLSFTLLPGMSASYSIEAQVTDFKMDSIDIVVLEANLTGFMPADDLLGAFKGISGGMDEIISGTAEMKAGLKELSNGIAAISGGLSAGTAELEAFLEGLKTIGNGFSQIAGKTAEIASASSSINDGISDISTSLPLIASGYLELENALSQLLSQKEALSGIASSFLAGSDPAASMLAQSILAQLEALSGIYGTIKILNFSLSSIAAGMPDISSASSGLASGLSSLSGSMASLNEGIARLNEASHVIHIAVGSLSEGLEAIASGISPAPDAVQRLIEGQKAVEAAVNDVSDAFASLLGTSAGSSTDSHADAQGDTQTIADDAYENDFKAVSFASLVHSAISASVLRPAPSSSMSASSSSSGSESSPFVSRTIEPVRSVQFLMRTPGISALSGTSSANTGSSGLSGSSAGNSDNKGNDSNDGDYDDDDDDINLSAIAVKLRGFAQRLLNLFN